MKPKTYLIILRGDWDESDSVQGVFGSLEALVAYRATKGPRWHWPRDVEVWETDGERIGDLDWHELPQADRTARPSEVKAKVRG